MSTITPIGRIMVKNVRLRFPKLVEPEQFQGEGEYAYTCAFILPKDHPQLDEIKAKIEAVAKAQWSKEYATVLKAGYAKDSHALHDGDIKASIDGYEGNLYISGRNSGKGGKVPSLKPALYNTDRTPLTDEGKLYDGAYANVSLEFWAQDNGYGKKVNCQIRGVQFAKDGDAFAGGGGSKAAADEFENVSEGADAVDFA